MAVRFKVGLAVLAWFVWILPCECQSATQPPAPGRGERVAAERPSSDQPGNGSIAGTVVDETGAFVASARIELSGEDLSRKQEVLSDDHGQFSFANIAPGPFQLTVTSAGFATKILAGSLHSGEIDALPPIALAIATAVTDVEVGLSPSEVAEEQVKVEEKQRVLGAIPNFYVSYVPDAPPLNSKQKFDLAWKTVVDPVTLLIVGGAAGVQQAENHFSGYGQGAQGYGERFGASYGDTLSGVFIGGAILPSLLKQDPRYFYKGSGSRRSRFFYAIANSVICKGDDRHWQANYSNILGSLAAGGISNLYYPAADRDGAGLTFENAAIGIGTTALANLAQEFLIRKVTRKAPDHTPAQPAGGK